MPHDDYEDPRKKDPRFPDRPTHPDFIRLSEIVQKHDIDTERLGHSPFEVLGVDEASFLYFLDNRLGVFSQRTHRTFEGRNKAMISALYMDAFALGKAFAEGSDSEAYNRIDDEVTRYQHEQQSAQRTLGNIAAIIADHESGEDV